MDLLDFARGPGLWISLVVFAVGSLWRLVGVLRLRPLPDLSPPRGGAPSKATAIAGAIVRGMWPRVGVRASRWIGTLNAWIFHVGLAVVVLAYAPHIAFIRRLTGLGWPALPDAVMYAAAAITLVALVIALLRRLTDPVLKLISTPNDYVTWFVTLLPIFTGMAALGEPSSSLMAHAQPLYRMPVAVHLLSLELMLLWFPFGKLMHAILYFFARGATGVRFAHRGVKA